MHSESAAELNAQSLRRNEHGREHAVVDVEAISGRAPVHRIVVHEGHHLFAAADRKLSIDHDVEALLVNRLGYSRGYSAPEYYQLPIDECYKLVGLIRAHWSGLSGGAEVWQQIGEFFRNIKGRAVVVENESGSQPPAPAMPAEEDSHA